MSETVLLTINQVEEIEEMQQLYDALLVFTWDDHELADEILTAAVGNAQ